MLIDASTIGLPPQHYSMSKNRSIGRAQLTFRASLMGEKRTRNSIGGQPIPAGEEVESTVYEAPTFRYPAAGGRRRPA